MGKLRLSVIDQLKLSVEKQKCSNIYSRFWIVTVVLFKGGHSTAVITVLHLSHYCVYHCNAFISQYCIYHCNAFISQC